MNYKDNFNKFSLTLEECKLILDNILGLVVVDEKGNIKYISPDMIQRISSISGIDFDKNIIGENIENIHPTSKILDAIKNNFKESHYFYFTVGITNISTIKPIYDGNKFKGVIDYDVFRNDDALNEFLNKLLYYSELGYINISEFLNNLKVKKIKSTNTKY